jgi:hypothetical protein
MMFAFAIDAKGGSCYLVDIPYMPQRIDRRPAGWRFLYAAVLAFDASQASISANLQRQQPGVNLIDRGKVGSVRSHRRIVR